MINFPGKQVLISKYETLIILLQEITQLINLRIRYRLKIMSSVRTVRYILRHKCSVARFGDGEFGLMYGEWEAGFQEANDDLALKLRNVWETTGKQCLICIPHYFNSYIGAKKKVKKIWFGLCNNNNRQIKIVTDLKRLCGIDYIFGNALFTRPYMDMKRHYLAKRVFRLCKKIWYSKNVLIVEGKGSRLGIGNNLFEGALSVRRILAPSRNAFDFYEEIKCSVIEEYKKRDIVLLALGPTATVLAAELSAHSIWVIDIGHIDIEYEWYIHKQKNKVAVDNKYTNEVQNGDMVNDCNNIQYTEQIIQEIG